MQALLQRSYSFGISALLALPIAASPARAADRAEACPKRPSNAKRARRLAGKWWKKAQTAFDAKDYATAIRRWQCSTWIAPHPLALFNVARAAELSGKRILAAHYYLRYLGMRPKAPDRKEVEARITRLTRKEPRTAPRPPTAPPRKGRRAPPRKVERRRPAKRRGVRVPPPPVRERIARRPWYKRWWFWTGMSVAVALAAGAGATGALALERSEQWKQTFDPADRRAGRRLRLAADIMWPLAAGTVIGVTIGAIMVAREKPRERSRTLIAPTCGPTGCGVAISGRF